MTNDFREVWAFLPSAKRRKKLGMLFLMILMAMAGTAGVLSIMPFLSVFVGPSVVHENAWLQQAFTAFGFANTQRFIIMIGATSIAVVVTASAHLRSVRTHTGSAQKLPSDADKHAPHDSHD